MPTSGQKHSRRMGGCAPFHSVSYVLILLELTLTAPRTSWLYCLVLTIDANFKMKLKDRGIMNDPALGQGWSQFVPAVPYHGHLKKYGHQVEVMLVSSDLFSGDAYFLHYIAKSV